ncbi:Nuclease [Actinidia chinensis var. chinensis]|uniref:Nuclease n=1 Tax=Actinidia chinensis var. chinensis TaxID=1590841 RepID=A0A2R6RSI2_ACTCC|nr:Nuclease [Actinidia chinensis var. chinensis]
MENSSGLNEKFDRLAIWVGTSVASAFFASLERCACVNLTTADSDDENEEEAKDRPLMFTSHEMNADKASICASVENLPV